MRGWVILLSIAVAWGCADETPRTDTTPDHQPSSQSPPPAPETTDATPDGEPQTVSGVVARILTVDLDGNPLPGMVPIATRSPNAFDNPMARGNRTSADGKGWVRIPPNEHAFVRAWDPAMERFANNYVEVPPSESGQTKRARIVMVEGATLLAVIHGPNNQPVAEASVTLTLYHANKGPWWPDRTTSDGAGLAVYDSVPAGEFIAEFTVNEVGEVQVPDVTLPPGEAVDLGVVRLRE